MSKSLGSSFDLIFSENLEDGSVTWVLVWKPTPVNEIRASSVEDGTRGLEFRRTIVFGPGSAERTATIRRAAREQLTHDRGSGPDHWRTGIQRGGVARASSGSRPGDRFDVRSGSRIATGSRTGIWTAATTACASPRLAARPPTDRLVTLTYDIERGPRTVIEIDWRSASRQGARCDVRRLARLADCRRRANGVRPDRARGARTPRLLPAGRADRFRRRNAGPGARHVHVIRGPQTRQLSIAWSGQSRRVERRTSTRWSRRIATSRPSGWIHSRSPGRSGSSTRAVDTSRLRSPSASPPFRTPRPRCRSPSTKACCRASSDVQLEGVDPARRMAATEALGLSDRRSRWPRRRRVEAARRLKAFYAELGYRAATVTHTLTTAATDRSRSRGPSTEGPLYRVKDVNVVGVETTSDRLVQKAIALSPGDAMSQTAIDTTRRNLYDIGSFRRVDFEVEDSAILPGTAGELPLTLTIQAEEPQRFQLKYGVQFNVDRSTGKGGGAAFGGSVELRDRNFIGRAVQASVGAHWDPDLQIDRTAPFLATFPRQARADERVRARSPRAGRPRRAATSRSQERLLDDRRRELTFEQRWRPASALELVWGYNFSSREFLLDRDEEHRDARWTAVGAGRLRHSRQARQSIRRHTRPVPQLESAVRRRVGRLRPGLRPIPAPAVVLSAARRLTAAGSVRYGTIQNNSDTTPISIIDLLFNAGGTNSVRGYAEDSLSAINAAGFALGGTDLLVLNGELRFPITKRFSAAAFVDAGNTFASIADITLGRLALGAGLGVRFRTPLAPLRLDFAHPFSNEFGKHGIRVHFSIGQMF